LAADNAKSPAAEKIPGGWKGIVGDLIGGELPPDRPSARRLKGTF
jgi:hypothetical protein